MDRLHTQPNLDLVSKGPQVFSLFGNRIMAYRRHFCAQTCVAQITYDVGREDFWTIECAKYYETVKSRIKALLIDNKTVLQNVLYKEYNMVKAVSESQQRRRLVGWLNGFSDVLSLEMSFLYSLQRTKQPFNHRPEHDYKYDDFHHFVGHVIINHCMVTPKMKIMALMATGQGLRNLQLKPSASFPLVYAIVSRHGMALQDVPKLLWKDRKVVNAALQNNGMALKNVYHIEKNNKDVVLTAVRSNGLALQYAYNRMRNDPEVVLAAVQQNGRSFQYAGKSIRNNKVILLVAMTNCPDAIIYASQRLQHDSQVTRLALLCDSKAKLLDSVDGTVRLELALVHLIRSPTSTYTSLMECLQTLNCTRAICRAQGRCVCAKKTQSRKSPKGKSTLKSDNKNTTPTPAAAALTAQWSSAVATSWSRATTDSCEKDSPSMTYSPRNPKRVCRGANINASPHVTYST